MDILRGFPLKEDIETITELDYYDKLIKFIEDGNEKEAINLFKQNLNAEFIVENISPFEEEGFEFLDVNNISANSPYVEEIDGVKIPLFKWMGASFSLKTPKVIITG